jgi:uncharacterized phage protein (predicted DNA packaging)
MILILEEAKKYLKLDLEDTEEDTDVTALINAAEGYLKNAGCTLNLGDEVAKLAIKMLVVHWYENREPIGKADKLAYGLQALITQLQYCYSTESGGTP